MLQFFIRRLGVSLLVAITVSVIGFALLRLSGDLASALAGETATPEEIARVAGMYGLDRPLYVQYFDWCGARCTAISAPRCSRARPCWN